MIRRLCMEATAKSPLLSLQQEEAVCDLWQMDRMFMVHWSHDIRDLQKEWKERWWAEEIKAGKVKDSLGRKDTEKEEMKGKLLYGNGQMVVNRELKWSVFWWGQRWAVSVLWGGIALWTCVNVGGSCWSWRELLEMACAWDLLKKSSSINPQAGVVQSSNEASGSAADSRCKNNRRL